MGRQHEQTRSAPVIRSLTNLRSARTTARTLAQPWETADPMRDTLHVVARDAMSGLVSVASDSRVQLPGELARPLRTHAFPPFSFRRRSAALALRVCARRAEARHTRAREAFSASQQAAIKADYVAAEAQVVIDVLSPRDPQYARASQKSQTALVQAREAAARADTCYRALRASSVEGWIRCLASMPLPVMDAEASKAHLIGRAAKGANWRMAGGTPCGFLPTGRLAGRRLTRCRVSEGAKAMSNAAKQLETEEVRATGAIWDAVIAGASLKDIQGISSETMDGLYAHAYDFYSKGQLAQAEAFFRFLCIYDFYNPEYIVGLAAVCQLKGEYQKAVDLYAMAFAVGKNDYRPVFYAGQCQMLMQDAPAARECFSLVCESSFDGDLRSKAKAYLTALDGVPVQDTGASAKEAA